MVYSGYNGSIKFFRQRVLTFSRDEILAYVEQLEGEAKSIKKEILRICWNMRGMSYNEAMNLSFEDRELISEITKENVEITNKSGLPHF